MFIQLAQKLTFYTNMSLMFTSFVLYNVLPVSFQSNETGGSYHMELEGLRRSLDIFEAHSLVVAVLVTDRHPQLSAWLEREHPDICHLFDCWHVAKGRFIKVIPAPKSSTIATLSQPSLISLPVSLDCKLEYLHCE